VPFSTIIFGLYTIYRKIAACNRNNTHPLCETIQPDFFGRTSKITVWAYSHFRRPPNLIIFATASLICIEIEKEVIII